MLILGIESSCDETSVAVVENGRNVLSCEIATSLGFHKRYGGIIPEIASRKQVETISAVADAALKDARVSLSKIQGICVTHEPGLLGSLLVGVCFAKAVSASLNIPILGINHLESHVYAPFLGGANIRFPFAALIVSGGHTNLYKVRDFDKITLFGSTQDDACGEAFDKVAKIINLGYPGGPSIEKAALKGNPHKIRFSCGNTENPYDFSFSGIKTAVLYHVRKHALKRKEDIADLAASFQETVIDSLIKKSLIFCEKEKLQRLVFGGGVVANNRLREKFTVEAKEKGIKLFFPGKEHCMDNAAMVAGLGYALFKKGMYSNLEFSASS